MLGVSDYRLLELLLLLLVISGIFHDLPSVVECRFLTKKDPDADLNTGTFGIFRARKIKRDEEDRFSDPLKKPKIDEEETSKEPNKIVQSVFSGKLVSLIFLALFSLGIYGYRRYTKYLAVKKRSTVRSVHSSTLNPELPPSDNQGIADNLLLMIVVLVVLVVSVKLCIFRQQITTLRESQQFQQSELGQSQQGQSQQPIMWPGSKNMAVPPNYPSSMMAPDGPQSGFYQLWPNWASRSAAIGSTVNTGSRMSNLGNSPTNGINSKMNPQISRKLSTGQKTNQSINKRTNQSQRMFDKSQLKSQLQQNYPSKRFNLNSKDSGFTY